MTVLIFFVLGLIVGSFLNVVISRLAVAEKILGRSHCPKCKAMIRWYDNVPLLSFILLKTRCRDCHEKISWQYPTVEIATGIIFALVASYFFVAEDPITWLATFYWLIIFSVLVVIFSYDFKHMEIPMVVLWIGIFVTVAYHLFADWVNFNQHLDLLSINTYSGVLAGAIAFLLFFALSAGSKEKWMGMGDAYVALLAGLIIGWPGLMFVLFAAFTLGAIYGVTLIAMKKKSMKSQVPFAPFIVAGIFLSVLIPQMFPSVKYWFIYL